MGWTTSRDATDFTGNASAKLERSGIRALIDEATTDSNDESDEHAGLLSMIRDEVVCPFPHACRERMSIASGSSGQRTAMA